MGRVLRFFFPSSSAKFTGSPTLSPETWHCYIEEGGGEVRDRLWEGHNARYVDQ